MDVSEALLESWRRQTAIWADLLDAIDESSLDLVPSEDGWTIATQLAHVHQVRRYWFKNASGLELDVSGSLYRPSGEDWLPSVDLSEIRQKLDESGKLVGDWVDQAVRAGRQTVGNYDHPVLYLQHMLWHEGWHFGLIVLALRRAGRELPEEWEEQHVWGRWRATDEV